MNAADVHIITSSIERMTQAIDAAIIASSDPPDALTTYFGTRQSSGIPGRPSVDIQPEDLARLAAGRTSRLQIAQLYDCSARTVRRRLLEYGLSSPGPPVYVDEPQLDGTILRTYSAGIYSNLSHLTDGELDQIMLSI
jgi:hypothetical protein